MTEFHESVATAELSAWFNAGGDEFLTYADAKTTELMEKLQTQNVQPLGECSDVQRGVTPFNLSGTARWATSRPAFDGTVRRYTIDRGMRVFVRFDDTLAEPKPERYFKGERLLLRELISRQFRLQAVKVREAFVTNKSMQSILPIPDGPELNFLLGCLNSRLISWYFLRRSNIAQRDDFPKIVLKETRSLPIPIVNEKNSKDAKELSGLVHRMLGLQAKVAKAKSDRELRQLQRAIASTDYRIDQLVYKLYGLTVPETALVEGADTQILVHAKEATTT